jgi:hypothetical protein
VEPGRAGRADSRSAGGSTGRGRGTCPELGAEPEGSDSPETRDWNPVRLAQERGCACGCGGCAGGQGPGRPPRRDCGSDDIPELKYPPLASGGAREVAVSRVLGKCCGHCVGWRRQ